jgi:ribosomal-protein-serine acetyltransferase
MPRLSLGEGARLRPLRDRDARGLFEIIDHNRARLRRWLSWLDDHRDVEAVRALIVHHRRDFARGHSVRLGIEYHAQIVGIIGLQRINQVDRTASLGYWTSPSSPESGWAATESAVSVVSVVSAVSLMSSRCYAGWWYRRAVDRAHPGWQHRGAHGCWVHG